MPDASDDRRRAEYDRNALEGVKQQAASMMNTTVAEGRRKSLQRAELERKAVQATVALTLEVGGNPPPATSHVMRKRHETQPTTMSWNAPYFGEESLENNVANSVGQNAYFTVPVLCAVLYA